MIETNKIYLGDAYELIKSVPDKSIDLIMTDPPYKFPTGGIGTGIFKHRNTQNETYSSIRDGGLDKGIDSSLILPEFVRVLKKINIYIWCNKEQIYDYIKFFVEERKCNFEIIVWAKTNPPPFTSGHYLKDKEYCLYFWEQGVKLKGDYSTLKTVYLTPLNVKDKKTYNHPTIKPIDIIETLIKNSTKEGDTVLDPFLGSGTSCVAAKHLGLNYIGFEVNENYYKTAKDRLEGFNQKGEMNLFDI